MTTNKKTIILGLGNILLQDEGIGVHALKAMTALDWPENVDLLDGGTGGFVLLSLFQEYENMVIIDATLNNEAEGSIKVIRPKFAKDFPKSLSTHELGLKDMVESSILLGNIPNIYLVVVSINPKQKMSVKLTTKIEQRIPAITGKVKEMVNICLQ